jgi:hypothetical protein
MRSCFLLLAAALLTFQLLVAADPLNTAQVPFHLTEPKFQGSLTIA